MVYLPWLSDICFLFVKDSLVVTREVTRLTKEILTMKKCFFAVCLCVLFFSTNGCVLEFDSGDDDSDTNGTVRVDSLQSYSAIDHVFLENLLDNFRTLGNVSVLSVGADTQLQGEVTAVLKILGKVAQVAGKVKSKKDEDDFDSAALSDLDEIKNDLEDLDKKVTDGFSQILNEIKKSEFLDAWNSLADNHLTNIDTAWKYYLDADYKTGLLNKLSENDEATVEDFEKDVAAFVEHIDDYKNSLDAALTNIEKHVSGENGFSKILYLYADYLSTNNGNGFKDKDVMDSVLSQYLYLYMDLVTYQIKATILLDEYYNYTEVDPGSVVLTEDNYTTVTSEEASDENQRLVVDLKKGLAQFLSNGERLISQFNSGDIYREYASDATAIRNSDFYPYIDSYIQTIYGCNNLFVLRLPWSEEAATNDPDAVLEGAQVTGKYGYNYNYQALFDGLKDSTGSLEFVLEDSAGTYRALVDEDHPDNLTTISTFELHPQGRTDLFFSAGLRRFVFANIPVNSTLHLSYSTDLDTSYRFIYSYSGQSYGASKYADFNLYSPESIDFSIQDVLSKNNPLENIDKVSECVSYTFGAYMADFEYKDTNTLFDASKDYESQVEALYGPFSYDYYRVETSGNQHIELDGDKTACFFTVVPNDSGDMLPIYDGQKIVMYMAYIHNQPSNRHHGYMYQSSAESGNPIKFKEGMDNAIRFNIRKKYIFPSGKLFSNDTIKRFTYFMLEKGTLCVHSMSDDHDNRLEFYKSGAFSMNNWFFLDNRTPSGLY